MSSTSFSTGTGLKKCMPTTLARPGGGRAQPHDRDGGGVGGQDGVPGQDQVQLAQHRGLDRLDLDHGLDRQLPVGELLQVLGEADPAQRRLGVTSLILPALTARFRDTAIRSRPRLRPSAFSSATITSSPPRAQTSAMPDPIWPTPTTPTRSITDASGSGFTAHTALVVRTTGYRWHRVWIIKGTQQSSARGATHGRRLRPVQGLRGARPAARGGARARARTRSLPTPPRSTRRRASPRRRSTPSVASDFHAVHVPEEYGGAGRRRARHLHRHRGGRPRLRVVLADPGGQQARLDAGDPVRLARR